jgi:hypothetical protein
MGFISQHVAKFVAKCVAKYVAKLNIFPQGQLRPTRLTSFQICQLRHAKSPYNTFACALYLYYQLEVELHDQEE